MQKLIRNLFITCLFAAPVVAVGAPWCVALDGTQNCRFATAEDCYTYINIAGGYCSPNPRELGVSGNGPYCVITAGSKNCNFRSRGLCLSRARAANGGCVRNTEVDLARRAAGEARLDACETGDIDCGGGLTEGGLEAAGYGSQDMPTPEDVSGF